MYLNTGSADPKNKILWDEYKADRAAGGFTLADTLPTGALYLLKGSPINVNYTTRVATLVKSASIVGGTTAAPTVKSSSLVGGHNFKVGDVISDGTVALAIASITAGAVNDTLAFTSGTLVSAAAGVKIYEVLSASTTASGKSATSTVVDTSAQSLTATAAVSKTMNWNDVTLQIAQSATDALIVTFIAGVLKIQLAKTTASKNSVALIGAAVAALGTVDGYDLTKLTFTGSSWDGGQTGATLTTPVTLFTGGVLQVDVVPKYLPNALLSDNTKILGSPTVTAVTGVRDVVQEANLPYPVSTAMKTAFGNKFNFV